MKFRTPYCTHERCYSPSGSRFIKTYVRKVNPDGTSALVESGTEDVYDSIQKAALGNTIDDLIRRAKAGDSSAIPPVVDSYADLTHAPKDMLEAHQILIDARSKFNSLPADLRSKYNNNFDKFLEASASGEVVKSLLEPKPIKSDAPTLTADEITALKNQLKSGGNKDA